MGVLETALASELQACTLTNEVCDLLLMDAVEVVPPQRMLGGHFLWFFLVSSWYYCSSSLASGGVMF